MNNSYIVSINWEIANLFDKYNYFSRDCLEESPINVFYMKNRGGKTLLFTMLFNALSGSDSYNINKTYGEILLKVNLRLWDDEYVFNLAKTTISIIKNGKVLSKEEYHQFLWTFVRIFENLKFEYDKNKPQKNTFKSMFRYLFFSDHDIRKKNRGENREISFVNSHFDFYMKKALLGYFLWIDISNKEFCSLEEYYLRVDYTEKNKSKYLKYRDVFSLFSENKTEGIFKKYEAARKTLGDITVAADHLRSMIQIRLNLEGEGGGSSSSEDRLSFLQTQLLILDNEKKKIEDTVLLLKKQLFLISNIEKEAYYLDKNSKIEDMIYLYSEYEENIKYLGNQNSLKIQEIDKVINDAEKFIEWWLKILGFIKIRIDLTNQMIKSDDARSEWEMSMIRILCWVLLNAFSKKIGWRLLNICVFDAIFESIDEDKWHKLFEKIQSLYEGELKDVLPQIFIFTTGINDRYNLEEFTKIKVYTKNFIDFN